MADQASSRGTESVIPGTPIHLQGLWAFTRPAGFVGRSRATAAHLVHLVESGGYRLTLAGRTWAVTAPALIWYHAGEPVAWAGDARPVRFRSCAFASPGLAPPPAGERVRAATPAVAQAFAALEAATAVGGLRGALACQAAACRWLALLLDRYGLAQEADLWERVERRALAVGTRAHVAALAVWAGVSTSTLERACRARHGCAPGQRLRHLRLAQAEALAVQGGLARPAVARLLGYADRRSLRRAVLRERGSAAAP